MMRRQAFGLVFPLILGLAGCQALSPGGREAPSVGTMVGGSSSIGTGEGWLVVDRADLVTPERSKPIAGSLEQALGHYESILELPAAAVELQAEALRRAAYLRIRQYLDGSDQGSALLHAALERYQRLFEEFPDAAGNDLARYQMARAHELLGERVQAAHVLMQLVLAYPETPLMVDAAFRAGELYYQEREMGQAAQAYGRVLEAGEDAGTLHALAAYKLGWARLLADAPEDAVDVFIALLDRLLPRPDTDCTADCLRTLASGEGLTAHAELGQDALRGLSLALMAHGGVQALAGRALDPARAPIYYWSLAGALQDRARFHDAADTYAAFVTRYGGHRLAPLFGEQVITAYATGGFDAPAMAARAHFVETFGVRAPYWGTSAPTEAVTEVLRQQLETLATHYHARAQAQTQATGESTSARMAAHAATGWYRQWLALMPEGERRRQVRMRYADALLESGALADAAEVYRRLAYEAPMFAASDEAALAEVQTLHRIADALTGDKAAEATRHAIDASHRLAERRPVHAQRSRVLVRAAEEAFDLGAHGQAIELAGGVLETAPANDPLVARATLLLGDSYLVTEQFAEAEARYEHALAIGTPNALPRDEVKERLATAIYRQAEQARAGGAFREAAAAFLRVGDKASGTSLHAKADFDAASMMIKVEDWGQASELFGRFLDHHGGHDLVPDAEKWLATAYERNDQPGDAAPVYARIAARSGESVTVRREAQWKAARLYDAHGDGARAYRAYGDYVSDYPTPVDSAQQARMRLAELAEATPAVQGSAVVWWQAIISVQRNQRQATPYSELMAARAHMHLGRYHAARAAAVALRHPMRASLGERQRWMREAITHFQAAGGSGFEGLVTPASYAIGAAYEELVAALQRSERPPSLRGFEKDAYELLLEDQIFPIEEQAIEAHRRNLDHLSEGLWDEWVLASARALSQLVPGRYARQERQENVYAQFD